MAKRKRLTPARTGDVTSNAVPEGGPEGGLETKALFPQYPLGVAPKMRAPAPPIAHVAADAATAAALSEVTAELQAARSEGRMVQSLALSQIEVNYLVRDRVSIDDDDMATLRTSLQARGQQTPIEVVEIGQGRYGLISGWRRLSALSALHAETGEDKFATVLALVRQPQDASEAYVAMVEENEIRVGLSYFERARIVARAVEEGVYETQKKALNGLFGSSSRTKRSKIKSFLPLVDALEAHLTHPAAIGERLGLALSQKLQEDPTLAPRMKKQLTKRAGKISAEGEQALLSQALKAQITPPPKPAKTGQGDREEIAPGLWVQRSNKGILISGPSLTPEIEARLKKALKS